MDRLYIIVRGDLKHGQQLAQSVHAAFEFYHHNPSITSEWIDSSNYVVCLNVDDEESLISKAKEADSIGIVYRLIREPDLNFEATALALQPGPEARTLCAQLPLALRQQGRMLPSKSEHGRVQFSPGAHSDGPDSRDYGSSLHRDLDKSNPTLPSTEREGGQQ